VTVVTSLSQDQCFATIAPSYDGGGAFPFLVELRAAAEWRPYFLVKMEAIHKSVMSRSELVFVVFFQKRSILSSQGQIIFVYDPWLTPHGRKVWKNSKLRPLPNLSVVVLAYEAKRQHRSGNYLGCVPKKEVQIKQKLAGQTNIETRQQSRQRPPTPSGFALSPHRPAFLGGSRWAVETGQ
jgi:hypothetical protein